MRRRLGFVRAGDLVGRLCLRGGVALAAEKVSHLDPEGPGETDHRGERGSAFAPQDLREVALGKPGFPVEGRQRAETIQDQLPQSLLEEKVFEHDGGLRILAALPVLPLEPDAARMERGAPPKQAEITARGRAAAAASFAFANSDWVSCFEGGSGQSKP